MKFIEAYKYDNKRDLFVQISINSEKICVIEEPTLYEDKKTLYVEEVERDTFIDNIEEQKTIALCRVTLENGEKYYVKEYKLGYVGNGVYCAKESY